ncbi:MAG: HAD-IIB family hydrolase, partial [Acidimicrobiia bacterium]
MAIRLIAIDIDGTLLDSGGVLPLVNRDAIVQAIADGVEVLLVTGRSFHFARPVADQLPDGLILIVSNGALIKTRD